MCISLNSRLPILLHVMNHFSIFFMSVYVCIDTSMYVGTASFPGTPAPECEHWNHAASFLGTYTIHVGMRLHDFHAHIPEQGCLGMRLSPHNTLICSFPCFRMWALLAEESLVSFLMWAWHNWSTRIYGTFCTLFNRLNLVYVQCMLCRMFVPH